MKIIILGSGNVSIELAKYLVSSGHAVTIADQDFAALSDLGNRIDLRVVQGDPSSPVTLRKAGAENTELLVATTSDDEANITACCVAHFLFKIPRKIARIRSIDYLREQNTLFGPDSIPIDHIIATERIITENIEAMMELPGISAYASFDNNRVVVVSSKVERGGKLVKKEISKFNRYDGKACVLAVYRHDKLITNMDEEFFEIGDEVYFCCERDRTLSQLSALRPLKIGDRNITIAGGTHISDSLAETLSERYNIKVIEMEEARANRLSNKLQYTDVNVYCADPMDIDFMREENLDSSDLYIAATPHDDTNIMSSLIYSRIHNVKTLAVLRSESYVDLALNDKTDIDAVVFPKESIISAMLSNIRQEGVENIHLFRQGRSEAIELTIRGSKLSSRVVGHKVESLNLPKGVKLGLVIRDRKLMIAENSLVLKNGDKVIVYLDDNQLVRKVVSTFRPFSFWIPKKWS